MHLFQLNVNACILYFICQDKNLLNRKIIVFHLETLYKHLLCKVQLMNKYCLQVTGHVQHQRGHGHHQYHQDAGQGVHGHTLSQVGASVQQYAPGHG